MNKKKGRMKSGRTGWLVLAAGVMMAMYASAANVNFIGGGVDNNFSTAVNWSQAPLTGDSYVILAGATTSTNPAVLDAGFAIEAMETLQVDGTRGTKGNAFLEVASGVDMHFTNLKVGTLTTGAHNNQLVLKSGSALAGTSLNSGATEIGTESPFRSGQMILESGVSFQTAILTLNSYGILTYEFGTNSISTLMTTRTTAGGANTLNGLVQVDLADLTAGGTYTLIDSSSANLLIGGALRAWLDGQGGSCSNTGSFANTHFEVLHGGASEWILSLADSNQDLNFTVIPKPMQSISLNDSNIHIFGTQYINRKTNSISFQRHSDYVLGLSQKISGLNPLKARTTSGIVLAFKTDSSTIEMSFRMLDFNNRGPGFGVYQNGVLIAEKDFAIDRGNPNQILTIKSVSPQTGSVFEVVMPSWSNTELFDMKIDGDASLLPYIPPVRKKYVAFGDSISHGTGQQSYSHWTWPFKLSRALGVELFNIAVGGSQVSSVCGEMMADFPPVDVITVLWGFNDWRAGVPKASYQTRIDDLITTIRSHQPTAEIFCITATYTTITNSPDGKTTLDDYRQVVADLVAARQAAGDNRVHLVRGEEIIYSASQLKDPAHLNPDGATDLANGLFGAMNSIMNLPGGNKGTNGVEFTSRR